MPDSTLRDRLAWLYPPPPPPPDDGGGPLPEVIPLADRVPWLYSGERKGAGSWQHPSQFAPEGEGTLDPHGLPDPAGVRPQPPQLVNPPARFPGRGARAVSGLKEESAAGRQQPATQPLPPPPERGKLGEWLRSHPHGADKALLLHLFGSRDPWAAMHPDDLSAAREGLAGAPPQQLLRLLHGLNGSGVHDPARHRIVHEAMASRPEGPEVPLTDRNRSQAYQFPDDGSMSDDDRRRLEQSLRALPRVKGLPGAFLLPAGLDPDRVFPGAGAKRLDEAAVDEAREASPAVWFQRPLPSEEEARSDDAAWRPLGVQSMNTYYGGNLWQVRYPDGRSYVAKLHHDPGEADVEAAAAGALRLMGFRDVPRMEVRPTRHGRTLFQSHAPGKELFAATGKDLRKIEKANPPEKLAELMAGMWLLNADDRHSGNYLFDADGRVYPIDLGFSLSPREFSREGWGQHRDALVEDGLVSRDQLVSPEFVRRAAGLRDRVLAHVERSLASQPEDYRRAAMAALGRRFDWLSRAAAEGRPVRLRDLPPLGSPKLPYRPAGSPERYRVEDLGGSGGGRGSFRPPHQEFVQEPLVKIHRAGPAHPHAAHLAAAEDMAREAIASGRHHARFLPGRGAEGGAGALLIADPFGRVTSHPHPEPHVGPREQNPFDWHLWTMSGVRENSKHSPQDPSRWADYRNRHLDAVRAGNVLLEHEAHPDIAPLYRQALRGDLESYHLLRSLLADMHWPHHGLLPADHVPNPYHLQDMLASDPHGDFGARGPYAEPPDDRYARPGSPERYNLGRPLPHAPLVRLAEGSTHVPPHAAMPADHLQHPLDPHSAHNLAMTAGAEAILTGHPAQHAHNAGWRLGPNAPGPQRADAAWAGVHAEPSGHFATAHARGLPGAGRTEVLDYLYGLPDPGSGHGLRAMSPMIGTAGEGSHGRVEVEEHPQLHAFLRAVHEAGSRDRDAGPFQMLSDFLAEHGHPASEGVARAGDFPEVISALAADPNPPTDEELDRGGAIPNWESFRSQMDKGYVPTIYADTPAKQHLIRRLVGLGYPVYGGGGTGTIRPLLRRQRFARGGSPLRHTRGDARPPQEPDFLPHPTLPGHVIHRETGVSFSPQEVARHLRSAVVHGPGGRSRDKCLAAAAALRLVIPHAEEWYGPYQSRADQAHTIARLGDHFIDVTADQFGGPDIHVAPELRREDGYDPRHFMRHEYPPHLDPQDAAILARFRRHLLEAAGQRVDSGRGSGDAIRFSKAAGGHPVAQAVANAATEIAPDPSPAQVEASNHKMGHVRLHGLDVTLEVAKGGTRTRVGKDGKPWSRKMHAHYGRIRRTEAADGEHLDVYLGDHPQSELVVVVEQLKENGRHDEFKCILPGQLLQGNIVGASKALYSGEVVQLRCASGKALAVTANHPVLTLRGMVPAGDLQKGDYLLAHTREGQTTASGDDEQNVPTAVEEVFRSLAELYPFALARKFVSSLDFHGDAERFQSQIDVVRPDGELRSDFVSQGQECVQENNLVRALKPQTALIGDGSSDPGFQTEASPGVGTACDIAYPFGVDRSLLGRKGGPPQPQRFGLTSDADLALLKSVLDNTVIDSKAASDVLSRLSARISPDQIIDIKVEHYDGPVYDFESTTGLIVVNQLLISNCVLGCTSKAEAMDLYLRHYPEGWGTSRVGDVRLMTVPQFKEWAFSPRAKKPFRSAAADSPERYESRHADDDARNGGGNSAPEGVQYARGSERPRAASTAGVAGPTPREGQSVSQSTDSSVRTPQRYSEAWPHPALLHVERHGGFAHGAPFLDPDTFPPPEHPHSGDHWAITGAMGNAIKGRPIGIGFHNHRSGLSPTIQTMQLPGDARPRRHAVEERQVFLSDPEGRITAGHYRMPLGVVVGRGRNYNASQLDPEAVRRYLDAQLPGLGGYLTDWPLRAGAADRHDLKSWEEMTPEERGNIERHLRRMAAEHARALRTGHTYAVVHAHPGIKPFLQSATGRGDEGLAELIDHMQEVGHPNAAQWAEMYRQAGGEGYPLLHTNLLGQMMRTPFDAGPLRASRAPSGEARAAERHAATGSPQRYSESPLKLQGPLVGVRHHGHFGYDGAIGGRTESDGINRGQYIHAAASAAARALAHDSPHGVTVRSKPIGGRREMSHVFALPDGRVAANRAMRNNIPTTDAQLASALGPPESHWLHGDDFPPALHPNTISRGQRDARIMMGAAVEDADRTGRLHAHVAIHPDPQFRAMLRNAVLGGPGEAGMLADWLRDRGHEDEANRLVGPDGQILHHGPAVAGALAEEVSGEGPAGGQSPPPPRLPPEASPEARVEPVPTREELTARLAQHIYDSRYEPNRPAAAQAARDWVRQNWGYTSGGDSMDDWLQMYNEERQEQEAEREPRRPGVLDEDGAPHEPEQEPDLAEYVANRHRGDYGEAESITPSTGWLLPDGRPVEMGDGRSRGEDHRGSIPTSAAMRRWGWPEDVVRQHDEGTRWPALAELMRRGRLVRIMTSDRDVFAVDAQTRMTGRQRDALLEHIMRVRPRTVVIETPQTGRDGREFDGHDVAGIERFLSRQ